MKFIRKIFNTIRGYTPLPKAPAVTQHEQLSRINQLITNYDIMLGSIASEMSSKTPYNITISKQLGKKDDLVWTNKYRPHISIKITSHSSGSPEHVITLQPNVDNSIYFHDERREYNNMGLPTRYSAVSTSLDNTDLCFRHLHKRLNEIMPLVQTKPKKALVL